MSDHRDHLRALHQAYVDATGLPVTLSHERMQTLREFDRRGFTSDDVRGVMLGLMAAVKKGVKGYTENSVAWRNAMANVDVFEERLLKYRQAKARRAGAAREAAAAAPRPISKQMPDGGTVNVLDSAPAGTEVPKIDLRRALRDLADEVGRKKP